MRELLEQGNEHARRNAAIDLGLSGDSSVRPILREIVETAAGFRPKMTKNPHQNQPRNLAAIHLLGHFRNRSDAEFLLGILSSFPEDAQIFSHTLRSLLELGDAIPELRTGLRKQLDAIFSDSRFSCRLLMKNSSFTGEQVYRDLNDDLRALAEKHFTEWNASHKN